MKAAIIGGGLGGLALALRLRNAGWEVSVFENGSTFGGKMNRWSRDGFTFDTGPSLITMPHVFAELYDSLGERMEDHLQLRRFYPHAEYIYADGARLVCPGDPEAWERRIAEVEPRDVAGFRELHELGRRLFQLSRRTFFERSPYSLPRLSELPSWNELPLRHAWGNYARTVDRLLRSPYLRQLYNRYPTYVGSSPYLCPATLLVIPYIEHQFGGWYVQGGLYRIVESLVELARRRGVELHHSTAVSSIERTGTRVTAVRLERGGRVAADAVVMNGDAATLRDLLGLPPRPRPESRSLSGFVMLLGLDGPLAVPHHSVYFSSDYHREFADLFSQRRFPLDPTVYLNAPCDPAVAPPGCCTLFVMANSPGNGGPWSAAQTADAEARVFERLERGGLGDLRSRIRVRDVWHPGRFEQRYLAPGGAIYGDNSHGWKNAFLRPRNRYPGLGGLYLVGGSSHPGGGTPMVLLSARITAAEMARRHASPAQERQRQPAGARI